MSLTLLVENNPKFESFYILNLTTWLGLDIITKGKAEFAVRYLEENHQNVDLIIVRSTIGKEASAKIILEYQKLKNLNIPVIILGPGEFGDVPQIKATLELKQIIRQAATLLKITAKEMSEKVVPDFFPIPITFFHEIPRSVCPVYAQDIDDETQYHVTIEKMKPINSEMVKELIESGIAYLYVDKINRLDFVSNVTSELITKLEQSELNDDEIIQASEQSIELLSKKLLTIGITEETITLAKKNIDSIRNNTRRNPKLAKLLDRLLTNKSGYLFKHTQILTYIALHIIRNIDWGTPEQEDKISFITFFHDIALATDEQAMINSNRELKTSKLSTEERALVERHAQIAAELVSQFPHAPMGADQIIRQHHGQLNGVGFSDHYGANISPMAIVFIVAEEFTRIIMKREHGPFNIEEMLHELKAQFPTNRFAKIVEKLQNLTF